MKLSHALAVKDGDVVSLVGGGGKTTAMFRLAEELVHAGKHVVTTTTTRIFAAQIKLAPLHIFVEEEEHGLGELKAALESHPQVLVVRRTNEEGKALGVEPSLVDRIHSLEQVDVVINEADGSRMRPFKAPGSHEPVIPSSTTLLVPVVGIDALGEPLDDEHVHRADQAAVLAGVRVGSTVDPVVIARVLTSPEGGLKNRPDKARVIPLINKVGNVAQVLAAREIATLLIRNDEIEAVAVGAVKNAAMPVAELHRRVAVIILAAGGSTRMNGRLKQLLPWGSSTLIRHTAEIVLQSQAAEVIVVLGKQAEDTKGALQGLPVRSVLNPDWAQGRSTSVRAGLRTLSPNVSAALFVNADQPFLSPQVIDSLLARYFQTLAPVIVPVYAGKTGSPVLFDRGQFPELEQLTGENGGKTILEARREEAELVNILDARAAIDVDTPEEYRRALEEAASKPVPGIMPTSRPGD